MYRIFLGSFIRADDGVEWLFLERFWSCRLVFGRKGNCILRSWKRGVKEFLVVAGYVGWIR